MQKTILKGRKLQMSQIFMDNGKVIPVTVVELDSANNTKLADNFLNMDVAVTGKSKGKGFTGAIKRWGFAKQGETRGASNKVRAPGAIGSQTPGRVYKGKKMAGHKGNIKVTIKGLKIVKIDSTLNQVMVSGPIPGARNSEVFLNLEGIEELVVPEVVVEAAAPVEEKKVEVKEEKVEKVEEKVEEKIETKKEEKKEEVKEKAPVKEEK